MSGQSSQPTDFIDEKITGNGNKMYRVALAIMGNTADAEDVIQDVFVKLIQKHPHFESPEHETAWLIRVTANLCKDRLKSYWRRNTAPLVESIAATTDERSEVLDALHSLPEKYRLVIHLFYYEGYSTREIAEITQQRESAVRAQLTRARQKLRINLKGTDEHGYQRI